MAHWCNYGWHSCTYWPRKDLFTICCTRVEWWNSAQIYPGERKNICSILAYNIFLSSLIVLKISFIKSTYARIDTSNSYTYTDTDQKEKNILISYNSFANRICCSKVTLLNICRLSRDLSPNARRSSPQILHEVLTISAQCNS